MTQPISSVFSTLNRYRDVQYVASSPSTVDPASCTYADFDGATVDKFANLRVLIPSGDNVGVYSVDSGGTSLTLDPHFVCYEGATIRCLGSAARPTYRQIAANGSVTPTFVIVGNGPVTEFGADHTGATDSTTALNAALAAGVGDLLPESQYKINGTLILPAATVVQDDSRRTFTGMRHTRLHGSGHSRVTVAPRGYPTWGYSGVVGGSVIKQTSSEAIPAIKVNTDATSATGHELSDFELLGAGIAGSTGISYSGGGVKGNEIIENVRVDNFGTGIDLTNSINSRLRNVEVGGCDIGITTGDGSAINSRTEIVSATLEQCATGAVLSGFGADTVSGGLVENCGTGIVVRPAANVSDPPIKCIRDTMFADTPRGGCDVVIDTTSGYCKVVVDGNTTSGGFKTMGGWLYTLTLGHNSGNQHWCVCLSPLSYNTVIERVSDLYWLFDYGVGTTVINSAARRAPALYLDADNIVDGGGGSASSWAASQGSAGTVAVYTAAKTSTTVWGGGKRTADFDTGYHGWQITSGTTGLNGVNAPFMFLMSQHNLPSTFWICGKKRTNNDLRSGIHHQSRCAV